MGAGLEEWGLAGGKRWAVLAALGREECFWTVSGAETGGWVMMAVVVVVAGEM